MPVYDYRCRLCEQIMEITHGISCDTEKDCRLCGSTNSLERLVVNNIPFLITKSVTTLGQQAEKNAKHFGNDEVQRRTEISKNKRKKVCKDPEVPFWRNGSIPGLEASNKPIGEDTVGRYAKQLGEAGVRISDTLPKHIRDKHKKQS